MARAVLVWSLMVMALGRGQILAAAAPPSRPNVLLICVDDLKPLLGCYGDSAVKSPNIDRLAAQGLVFNSAYCNQAVCSPSRNALLVGLRPQTLGIYDLGTNFRRAAPDAVTLPQAFRMQGYRTEGLGKTFHVGHGNNDDLASWSVPPWKAKSNVVAYALPESKPKEGLTREEALFANKSGKGLPKGAAYESADVADNAYPDGALADEAVLRLEAAAKKPDEPFFMAVGFVKPHLPFCAPKKYWDLYSRDQFEPAARQTPPEGAPEFAPQFGGELRQYLGIPEQGTLDVDLQRTLIHGYYAATSYMDAQVGKVLDALKQTGLDKQTIIVLWGDHGWHLGDHGMWCKHTNYEQAARIPVIVVAPGVTTAGSKTSALIESVDIYPTLCELAGIPTTPGLDGSSFVGTLREPKSRARTAATHVYPRSGRIGRAIRTPRYRLVEWKAPGEPADSAILELYDYETDADETKNIAAEQPEVVVQLRAILATYPEAKPQVSAKSTEAAKTEAAKPSATAKPKQDRAAMFARRDKDGDGKLTREEFLANQPDPDEAPKRFITFDVNKDGSLSQEEFVSRGKGGKQAKP